MRWREMTIHTTEEAVEAVSNWLHENGAGGVSIEESGSLNRKRDTSLGQWYELPLNEIPEGEAEIKAYFAEQTDLEELAERMRAFLRELPGFGLNPGQAAVHAGEVNEEDWADAWKTYFKPVRVSDKLTVKPTWETYEAGPGEIIVELDPGMAFGTGTHATTTLCMKALEDTVRPGDHVIDVGTGSGILSVVAAKLGAERVLAIDLDPIAVSSANENARLNDIRDRIVVVEGNLLDVIQRTGGSAEIGVRLPVQVVVANILADIILLCIPDVHRALASGGTFVASGIIEPRRRDVEQALAAAGFDISSVRAEGDWVVILAKKR